MIEINFCFLCYNFPQNTSLSAAEQMISALPDIKKIELTDKDDFMVLACDGIWNFMSSDSVSGEKTKSNQRSFLTNKTNKFPSRSFSS